MTIETRMSFPEGGTECPPDESPLLGTSTATSPTSSDSGSKDVCDVFPPKDLSKASSGSIRRKRGYKRRSRKTGPSPLEGGKGDESSGTEGNCNRAKSVDASKNDSKDNKLTNDATKGNESVAQGEDLKKPTTTKAKLMTSNSAKEEAASRKSMRLRLRRRGNDSSGELYGPKKRPRYVERLNDVRFDDVEMKIMFMDTLGMCPRTPKKAPPDDGHSKTSSLHCNIHTETVLAGLADVKEEKAEVDEVVQESSPSTGPEIIAETHKDTLQPEPAHELISNESQSKTCESDDDEGWECWLTRLSSTYPAEQPVNTSPTEKEINESLIRLVRLGTQVNVVGVSSKTIIRT